MEWVMGEGDVGTYPSTGATQVVIIRGWVLCGTGRRRDDSSNLPRSIAGVQISSPLGVRITETDSQVVVWVAEFGDAR